MTAKELTLAQAERLARFELVLAQLKERQRQTETAMAEMRAEGNTKSYRFKELMAAKMTNGLLLSMFTAQGIE